MSFKSDWEVDRLSFYLGMINCFVEMVACGVKKLALSPPIAPEDYELLKTASENIAKGFGVKTYLEKELLITDLQSADFTRDKFNILFFLDDKVLNQYLDLKKEKDRLQREGMYNIKARKDISKRFGRLLSYPEHIIDEKLSQDTPPTPYMYI